MKSISPVIISASRRTDIPAFYSDWLLQVFSEQKVPWQNPYNPAQKKVIELDKVRMIVFWTKDPSPLLPKLHFFDQRSIHYYFLFTLNHYDHILEPGLRPVQERIDLFRKLSDRIGPDKVIWRFDPVILTKEITAEEILERFACCAGYLKGYTRKVVFSFLESYPKVKNRFKKADIHYQEFSPENKERMITTIGRLSQEYKMQAASCSEELNNNNGFEQQGVIKNKCIDDQLMKTLFFQDSGFIKVLDRIRKDKGQRTACGCMESTDIGQYHTCKFKCLYCYAR